MICHHVVAFSAVVVEFFQEGLGFASSSCGVCRVGCVVEGVQ